MRRKPAAAAAGVDAPAVDAPAVAKMVAAEDAVEAAEDVAAKIRGG
jgi:hypothetical protein